MKRSRFSSQFERISLLHSRDRDQRRIQGGGVTFCSSVKFPSPEIEKGKEKEGKKIKEKYDIFFVLDFF